MIEKKDGKNYHSSGAVARVKVLVDLNNGHWSDKMASVDYIATGGKKK